MIATPCYIRHHTNDIQPMNFTGYTPHQIRTAYSVDPLLVSKTKPSTVTVTIAYTYPNLQNDLDIFCQTYGLPLKKLKIVSLGTEEDAGWAMEECLDVQCIVGMNPYANIQVVEAVSSSFDDMFAALQYANNPPPGSPLQNPISFLCLGVPANLLIKPHMMHFFPIQLYVILHPAEIIISVVFLLHLTMYWQLEELLCI